MEIEVEVEVEAASKEKKTRDVVSVKTTSLLFSTNQALKTQNWEHWHVLRKEKAELAFRFIALHVFFSKD